MDDNVAATAAAAIQPILYVIFNCLFQIMLEFFVLAFGVDVIDLSPIDVICSSILLICVIGFSTVCMIMFYQFIIRIKSYGLLLIFPTIQKPDYRHLNSTGVAAATGAPTFDG